jgi:hypothetical protein
MSPCLAVTVLSLSRSLSLSLSRSLSPLWLNPLKKPLLVGRSSGLVAVAEPELPGPEAPGRLEVVLDGEEDEPRFSLGTAKFKARAKADEAAEGSMEFRLEDEEDDVCCC